MVLSGDMKAQSDVQMNARCSSGLKNGENKSCKTRQKGRDVAQEEMNALLLKLKELVPNMPRNRKLSKLEIIQYVIDYILDLQVALEMYPVSQTSISSSAGACPCRQPLGVLSPLTNLVVNTRSTQEDDHPDKPVNKVSESMSQPVSC